MSALPRGPHGGGTTSGRSTPPPGFRSRGAPRGSTSSHFKGRGGRGRGASSNTNPKAEGLLQGLQTGSLNKRGSSGNTQPRRGHSSTPQGPSRSTRGHGATVNGGNAPFIQSLNNPVRANPSHKDFMMEMTTKFQDLKQRREGERAKAIRDGFLADPEKKTSLDKAITPVGTCTEMCPEFERVERIVQNMVEKPEKISNETTGRDMPAEERMVKRFRRSAAGYDEQLPSDIRTPATLQATLNYLLDEVIGGGEQLAAVHKFVWDRTRSIRNDFSIQQVSKDEDVRLAVDCFEKIARFHIFALHQLSNPDNLTGDGFDAHQEREQLNNTLLSLIYYYDDNRDKQLFANEAEFRAYCIILELQSSRPDLEDRMQSWPPQLLNDRRVQIAFRLYSAATNTLFEQGPLKPTVPFSIAQGNSGAFWKLLKSKAVSYMMSCVAEIHFGQIRYMALQNLWESHKGPPGQQIRNQEWTLDELTVALAFDDDMQTLEFCKGYGLEFKTSVDGIQHLDFTSQATPLDQSSTPRKQVFSHSIVEAKRYRRSGVAIIKGVGVARAIREGLIEADPEQDDVQSVAAEEDSKEALFFSEISTVRSSSSENKPTSIFNPEASTFTPSAPFQPSWSSSTTSFGKPSALARSTPTTSTAMASTSLAVSGSSSPSFLPTSSTASGEGFGISSTPFVNPFLTQTQSLATSANAPPPPIALLTSDSKFGQTTFTASPPISATSPFSFGKPLPAPSRSNQLSAPRQQEWQHQANPEHHVDTPLFVPSLPGRSMPTIFWQNPTDNVTEAFSASESEEKGLGGSMWPDSKQQPQDNKEPANNPQLICQESLPPVAEPQQELGTIDVESVLRKPVSSRSGQLDISENFTTPLPSFPPSDTGSVFRFEGPFMHSNTGHTLPPRHNEGNTTQPQTASIHTPRPIPSSEPISKPSSTSSTLANTTQSSFNWTPPAPFTEGVSSLSAATQPKSSSLLPSQYPAPVVPPKHKKPSQPKVKELKAVSPHNPTPRDSSPLRERPVIFGDNANAFRQSAAFETNPPSRRTAISANSRDAAVETVARLAILQPAGLMREYLQFTLPGILKPIMQQHEQEKPILAASKPKSLSQRLQVTVPDMPTTEAARRQILARKYFKRWKANTYRRTVNRRARERRQLRIDVLEKEKQKRMRSEAELEAILQAKKEKERMQAEMLARRVSDSNSSVPNRVFNNFGQKRKIMHIDRTENCSSSDTPRKVARGHHRSRTMGHVEGLSDSSRSAANQASANTTTLQFRSSIFPGQSILNGSTIPLASRPPLSGRKDTTRTDYFRLKALGIDPDTPIVPDTKVSLERKRQREDEIAATTVGYKSMTRSSTGRPSLPQSSPQEVTAYGPSSPSQSWTPPDANNGANLPTATELNEDDELLRQIRDFRKAMTEGTEWFKKQAVNIEKEVEAQEVLRQSAFQASSRSSPHTSATGLARANGYEYLPGPEIQGRGLSRTELRIRRTGAHGFATKPIGGSEEYLAVAMSRNSAAKLNIERQSQRISAPRTTEKSRKSRRKTGEKDPTYIPPKLDESSEELKDEAEPKTRYRWREPSINGEVRAAETIRHPLKRDLQECEEHSGAEDDEDDVQVSVEQPQYGEDNESDGGDTEDLYEDSDDEKELYDEGQQGGEEYEEEKDDDSSEGEEQEQEVADEVKPLPYPQEQKGQGQTVGYWLRSSATPERGLTPNGGGQMMSRVSSGMGTGTGASADDALILDSD